MERKAHYALIGLFTFAVVAGAFGFVFWLHHSSGKKQAVAYRVIFDSSVSGLQVGGNVLFNGIRVGAVSLKGVSAKTALIEREEGEPPTLRADPSASQDMMQAAREVLNKAEEVITTNQEALHQAIADISTFSASLARNSDSVDSIVRDAKDTMSNAKEAT